MEKHIKEAMNEGVIKQAAKLYDIEFDCIKYHGGFENFIYMFNKGEQEFVLRFVHSDHKIYNYVLAELEFIDYLDKHGACVSTVIESVNNEIVEKIKINENDYFSASVFTRGKGNLNREYISTEDYWINLGEQIGLLHKLTKDFNPKHKRPVWHEDTLYQIADKVLVEDNLPVLEALKSKINQIKDLPQSRDNYGLIHTDLHLGNMVMDESNKLTFFDFDDSAYKHFISDIAIVIFYRFVYQNPPIEFKNEKTVWMLNNFFKGYNKNNRLPKEELLLLNDFLKLRELTLYTVIMAGGPDVYGTEWGKFIVESYKDSIINNTPFIDIDYVIKNLKF